MANHNLAVQNIGNSNTFQTYRDGRELSSIIDLTLTSELHDDVIHNWAISNSFVGSDHKMIHFSIKYVHKTKQTCFNFNKCDWGKFREILQTNWREEPVEWNYQLPKS
jgi:hypothetical protein